MYVSSLQTTLYRIQNSVFFSIVFLFGFSYLLNRVIEERSGVFDSYYFSTVTVVCGSIGCLL